MNALALVNLTGRHLLLSHLVLSLPTPACSHSGSLLLLTS